MSNSHHAGRMSSCVRAFWKKDTFTVTLQFSIQALIRSRASIDIARLEDPDVPLESLVGA